MAYLEAERLFATGQLSLRSDERMLREFRCLERRPGQGRDKVDHPKGRLRRHGERDGDLARGVNQLPKPFGGDLARLRSADVSTANVDNMSVDGPSRRASRGVTSSAGYRCGGRAAWITTRAYDWRNR